MEAPEQSKVEISETSFARLAFLDGLRGWGAVVVLIFHVFSDGFPVIPEYGAQLGLWMPFNGTMAVLVFFIVSGFSLSVRYLATGETQAWIRIAAGRYPRLAIPIFGASAIVHLAIMTGALDMHAERLERFSSVLKFEPSIAYLLSFSFFDVFLRYEHSGSYNPPLWTMTTELLGSVLTLVTIIVARPFAWYPLALVAIIASIVLFTPTINMQLTSLFLVGVMLAHAFNRGWLDRVPVSLGIVLIGIGWLIPPFLTYSVARWGLVGAGALTTGCIVIPAVRKMLSGHLSRELGRISFPLYLMQAPVIWIVGEPLVRASGQHPGKILAIDFLIIVLCFALAYLFLPINALAVRVSHVIGQWTVKLLGLSPLVEATSAQPLSR